jgi:hypothetical protein
VAAAAPFVPDWLFPGEGWLSLIDSQGVRTVSESEVDEVLQKHPLLPVGAVRTDGRGVRNHYAVTSWAYGSALYPDSGDVSGHRLSAFFLLPRKEGESFSDQVERTERYREFTADLPPLGPSTGHAYGHLRGWHRQEVTFERDDEGNLIATTDLRPPMSGDAESVEIWVSTNQKVIILTEEPPISVFRLVDRLGGGDETGSPSDDGPISIDDEVTPS